MQQSNDSPTKLPKNNFRRSPRVGPVHIRVHEHAVVCFIYL